MAQYALPDSDVSELNWVQGAGDGDGDHFDELDEGFGAGRGSGAGPDDATTYWNNNVANNTDPIRSTLSNVSDPSSSTGHILRSRGRKNAAAGKQYDHTQTLFQSSTTIAASTLVNITEVFTTITYTLTSGEADSITDYTLLEVSYFSTPVGGGSARVPHCSAQEFECPDAAAAGDPSIPRDWLNPGAYVYPSALRTFTNSVQTQLIGQDKFFGLAGHPNFDWPVPKGYVPSILRQWDNNLLQTTLAAFAPFGLSDWPVPRGSIPSIGLRTWTDPLKLNLQGQDSFFGDAGQVPTYDWQNPRGRDHPSSLRHWDAGNLLNTLFSFVEQQPFSLSDWPNPRGRDFSAVFRILVSRLAPIIAAAQPFSLLDWPNPRGATPAISLRTWIEQLRILAGRDEFFGLAGHPNFDWPNPPGARSAISLRQWEINLLQNTLGFVQSPFSLSDWPNPRGATPAITLKTWLDQLKINLASQDQFFGAAGQVPTYDWQNPRSPARVIDLQTWLINLLLTTLGARNPFSMSDWPNPRGQTFPADLRSFIDQLKLNLRSQDQFFGAAGQPPTYEWPNPKRRPARADFETWLNLLLTTLGARAPFSLSDWPNPAGKAFPTNLRTFLDSLELNLLGQDKFFGGPGQPPANLDWPVPKGAIPSISLRVWIDPLNLSLQGFGVLGEAFHELWGMVQTAPVTLDLTAPLPVDITVQFGAAGPTFVCTHIVIEELP